MRPFCYPLSGAANQRDELVCESLFPVAAGDCETRSSVAGGRGKKQPCASHSPDRHWRRAPARDARDSQECHFQSVSVGRSWCDRPSRPNRPIPRANCENLASGPGWLGLTLEDLATPFFLLLKGASESRRSSPHDETNASQTLSLYYLYRLSKYIRICQNGAKGPSETYTCPPSSPSAAGTAQRRTLWTGPTRRAPPPPTPAPAQQHPHTKHLSVSTAVGRASPATLCPPDQPTRPTHWPVRPGQRGKREQTSTPDKNGKSTPRGLSRSPRYEVQITKAGLARRTKSIVRPNSVHESLFTLLATRIAPPGLRILASLRWKRNLRLFGISNMTAGGTAGLA